MKLLTFMKIMKEDHLNWKRFDTKKVLMFKRLSRWDLNWIHNILPNVATRLLYERRVWETV